MVGYTVGDESVSRKAYAILEEHIIKTFLREGSFEKNGKCFDVIKVGKPRPQGSGECKTDVYVLAKERQSKLPWEIKISVKTEGSQEFQENKVSMERAEAYFGMDWEKIVYDATTSIKDKFFERPLLYASGRHPTKPNSVTLGWKLEIASKARSLSVKAPLTDQQIREYVYKGINQTEGKKNAIVNGKVQPNSGIAEYLLVTSVDKIHSIQDIMEQMEWIDDIEVQDTYLIFTANNYRTDVMTADGPRPLAVRVEWIGKDGKLLPKICFDHPLYYIGEKDMAPMVVEALEGIGKKNVDEIDPDRDLLRKDIFRK